MRIITILALIAMTTATASAQQEQASDFVLIAQQNKRTERPETPINRTVSDIAIEVGAEYADTCKTDDQCQLWLDELDVILNVDLVLFPIPTNGYSKSRDDIFGLRFDYAKHKMGKALETLRGYVPRLQRANKKQILKMLDKLEKFACHKCDPDK
ncbi:MAG TPA: hypothetical protein VF766_12955 [Pyrinomonadaceae bacterium]